MENTTVTITLNPYLLICLVGLFSHSVTAILMLRYGGFKLGGGRETFVLAVNCAGAWFYLFWSLDIISKWGRW